MELQAGHSQQPGRPAEKTFIQPKVAISPELQKPVDAALKEVLKLIDVSCDFSADEADVILCETASESLSRLKAGKAVIQINFKSGSRKPEGLSNNPQFSNRYRFISGLGTIVPELFSAVEALSSYKTAPDVKLPPLSPSPVKGKVIAVLDDTTVNLKSALAQLGTQNEVHTFDSYEAFLKKVQALKPDIVLLDMLMPAEAFTLGEQAKSQSHGAPFPAGIFAALAAAKHGVPLIVIATDAGHHDHPALAAMDWIGWNDPITVGASRLLILHAAVEQGVKDWGKSLGAALEL